MKKRWFINSIGFVVGRFVCSRALAHARASIDVLYHNILLIVGVDCMFSHSVYYCIVSFCSFHYYYLCDAVIFTYFFLSFTSIPTSIPKSIKINIFESRGPFQLNCLCSSFGSFCGRFIFSALLMDPNTAIAIIRGKKYPFMSRFLFRTFFCVVFCIRAEHYQHQQNGFYSLFRLI